MAADLGEQAFGPEILLLAYRQGLFPMADSRRGKVRWYSADPRAILPLDQFHVSRSLAKRVRQGIMAISSDRAFEQVIRRCADPRPYERQTWINDQIIAAYSELHHAGSAHSVEAWLEGPDGPQLVGGLYGVSIGAAFFGESMFSTVTDASKVCLVHLVHHLRHQGYQLLDVQFTSSHMAQFGVIEVPLVHYLSLLQGALATEAAWDAAAFTGSSTPDRDEGRRGP